MAVRVTAATAAAHRRLAKAFQRCSRRGACTAGVMMHKVISNAASPWLFLPDSRRSSCWAWQPVSSMLASCRGAWSDTCAAGRCCWVEGPLSRTSLLLQLLCKLLHKLPRHVSLCASRLAQPVMAGTLLQLRQTHEAESCTYRSRRWWQQRLSTAAVHVSNAAGALRWHVMWVCLAI